MDRERKPTDSSRSPSDTPSQTPAMRADQGLDTQERGLLDKIERVLENHERRLRNTLDQGPDKLERGLDSQEQGPLDTLDRGLDRLERSLVDKLQRGLENIERSLDTLNQGFVGMYREKAFAAQQTSQSQSQSQSQPGGQELLETWYYIYLSWAHETEVKIGMSPRLRSCTLGVESLDEYDNDEEDCKEDNTRRSGVDQGKFPSAVLLDGHGADIIADIEMFRRKGLKEVQLFRRLYSCELDVALRLVADNMTDVVRTLQDIANLRIMVELEDDRAMQLYQRLETVFAQLELCLEEIDPDVPIPDAMVEKLQGICDDIRVAGKGN
ncbi:hypothetical protein BDW74DRAFT_182578 [Aspergillus multicolor]|uniref:uncharacterized protein n=1 Tax=Aspergillus multicolor TaxID=41759 RepID=UPI003CCD0A43